MTLEQAIAFLEAIYGDFASSSIADDYVAEAKRRLHVSLPADLVTYYRRTASSKALHTLHNRIIVPADLDFAGEHLVIYEENQGVVVWGIARQYLGDANPPVDQGQQDGTSWTFHPEFPSLAHFAAAQGAWQAVQGALPCCGVLEGYTGAVEDVLGEPLLITTLRAWLVDEGVCVDAGGGYLGVATRSAEAFTKASERLKLGVDDWDWATLQDEE